MAQTQVTVEHLIYLIGLKEIELDQFKTQLRAQIQKVTELTKERDELKKQWEESMTAKKDAKE